MHQYLKKINHKKNLIDQSLIDNINSKINSTKKLKIINDEFFVDYESDKEFVGILQELGDKCSQYIKEKYLVSSCNIESTYLLEFNKNHDVNFDYYNGDFLVLQDENNFKYINMTECDLACVIFLSKTNYSLTFKLLSLNTEHESGDIVIYPLTYNYINMLCSSEENRHIVLMHCSTSPVVSNDNNNIDNLVHLKIPHERTYGYVIDNTFYPKFDYNHGLLAAVTSILYKLSVYKGQIDNINTSSSPGLDYFKKGYSLDKDIYPFLFKINNNTLPNYSHNLMFFHNTLVNLKEQKLTYDELYMIHPLIKKYFLPSQTVLDKIEYYKKKYSICPENTIAVHFRGTDKYVHKVEGDISNKHVTFINKIKEIQAENPNLSILLQSDDLNIINIISTHFDNIKTIIEPNLKPSSDGYPIHYGGLDRNLIQVGWYIVKNNARSSLFDDGIQHAIEYLAFIILASQCKFVVTHKGHGSLWTLLYRNSLENFYQF